MEIDQLSKTSLKITAMFNEFELASATGFTVAFADKNYLVTNWHVVNGRDPDTGKCLDSELCAIPNKILVNFHSSKGLLIREKLIIDLYSEDGAQVWIDHPKGQEIDVVLIPLEEYRDVVIYPMDLLLADVDMVPLPAMPISVIGYPLGLTAGGNWPIWKTGHIASDPDIDFQTGRPAFLIDATTREGMSGAPVVLRQNIYRTKDGNQFINTDYITKFMGVYAGRIHDDSEVGRVWRPFLINEIIAAYEFR